MKKVLNLFGILLMCTFLITVAGCKKDPVITVDGLEVSKLPTKVVYVEGETFDTTGMEVKKVLSDGSKVVVTTYSYDLNGKLTVKDKVVTLSYKEEGMQNPVTATVNITVNKKVVVPKKLVDVEFSVDENFKYVRTEDVSSHIRYREVYDDGSKNDWSTAVAEDLKDYQIKDGKLTVTASLFIKNKEWNKEVTVDVDDNAISVADFNKKEAGDAVYQVNGIIAGFGTTVKTNEVILMDKVTKEFVGVTMLDGGGKVGDNSANLNGFKVGDEIIIPVKAVKAEEVAGSSNSNKAFAEFAGGTAYNTAIVSRDNVVAYNDNIVEISNQEELSAFLGAENRGNNFYTMVKLHGEMRYIQYESDNQAFYRFFFDSKINTYEGQKIDGASPVFSNGAALTNTGKSMGELLVNDATYAPSEWGNPGKVTKDIYALFIGGNTYYHQFVILNENDVKTVTPELVETRFASPYTTYYNLNSTLDLSGAAVEYVYDYAPVKAVAITNEMLDQATLPNMSKTGKYLVKGSYEGFGFEFEVIVTDKVVNKLELNNEFVNNKFHVRSTLDDVVAEICKLGLKVTWEDATVDEIKLTSNMISSTEDWTIGKHSVKVNFLGNELTINFVIENQGISVEDIKKVTPSETVYDLHGVVISSIFAGGTLENPANGEILIKDMNTNAVIGLRGMNISYTNKLAGLTAGDEILVTVNVINATDSENFSEFGQIVTTKVGDDEIIVLSTGNSTAVATDDATLIVDQAGLDSFFRNADTRKDNAYTLIKLSAGAKLVSYNATSGSLYVTYNALNVAGAKVDGLCPYLNEINTEMTLGDATYLSTIFGADATNKTDFADPNILDKDVYLMYVGGTGSYYHQLVLLGAEYVTSGAAENLKEIIYTAPTKFVYKVGEAIDLTGANLNYVYYYDQQNKNITLDETHVTSSAIDTKVPGVYTIEFTYEDNIYKHEIIVTDAELESISLEHDLNTKVFGHRDNVGTIDLAGALIKLVFTDGKSIVTPLTRDMLPETDADIWKFGEVEYTITYLTKTTTITVTYENRAISVSEFKTMIEGEFDVTGIIVGPASSHGASELIIKDTNAMEYVGIYNTGIVGAYNALKLNTEIINCGDEVILTLRVGKNSSAGGAYGKRYATTSTDELISSKITLSTGKDLTADWANAKVTTIATQEELVNFINDENRFYTLVKLVQPKAVFYKNCLRIFFADNINTISLQKINGVSPVIYNETASQYIEGGLDTVFENMTSTHYGTPATTTSSLYALFVGGNKYYHDFAVIGADWVVPTETPAK